jgi:SAM-dependent methyltransferase
MVQCLHCGTIRQNPRLVWESLQHYYPEDYNSYFPLVREIANPLLRLEHRYGPWKRMRAIERRQPGGRLLELGCGSGLLLEEALRSGRWQVTGLEINPWAANKVRQALHIPVIEAPLHKANFPDNYFDVIVYWNVLEHLYQPIEDLRLSYQLLKRGGWLVIGLPNLESWERRLFAQDWIGWELPRHLHLFPRKTLRTILESIGFHWDWSGCISSSHATLGLSLQIWSQARKSNRLSTMLLRSYRSYLGKLVTLPGLWVADKLGLSTILAVFAQKPQSD